MEAMMKAAQQAQQGQNFAPAAPVEAAKSGGGDTIPDVPVEHLDYGYISKCESVQELKDILAVLQSGKEGRWYDLEKHCEDKLVKCLPPKERRLYLAQRTEPSYEQKEDAAKELAAFVSGISGIDNTLKLQKRKPGAEKSDPRDEDTIFQHEEASPESKDTSTREFPPIRGTLSSAPQKKDEKSINISHRTPEEVARDEAKRLEKQRLSGYDFRAWDKFDVDAELERLDKEEALERERKEAEIKERQAAIDARKQLSENSKASRDLHCDLEKLSDEQRNFFADREKEKGNESFKAGEFKDALNFYTRSITFLPASSKDPRPYSNRAMANIKLERWEAAEQDCDEALTLDADFAKAYARRGMARHQRGKYLDAIDDFEEALHREPSNTKLNKLLAESRKKYNEVGGIGADRPGAPARHSAGKHTFKKLMIIEDSDSDSDSDSEAEAESHSVAETKSEAAPKLDDEVTVKPTSESAPSPLSQGDAEETPVTNEEETKTEDIPNIVTSSVNIEASDKDQIVGTEEDLQKSWVNAKRLGAEALRNGEVSEAAIHFSKAINVLESLPRTEENQEHLVNCLGNKAVCLKESEEWSALVKVCDHVLSLDEENMVAIFRRGIAREHLGQLQSALEDMCTVLRIDPNRTEAGERISVLMGKLNGTIPLGEDKAKQVAPGKVKVQAEKATEDKAKTQEASKDETKAAEKSCSQNLSAPKEQASPPAPPAPLVEPSESQTSPPSSDTLKENGNELFRAQKYHEALAKYRECLSIDPQNLSALANCAMALLKVEEYNECTKVCSTGLNAVQTLDDSAKAEQSSLKTKLLYRRACAHRELGQLEASCSDFEAVLAQEPGNKRASLELQKTKEAAQAAIRAKSERERLEKLNQAAKKQQDLAERAKERAKAKVEARTTFPAPNSSYEFQQMWRTLSLEKRAEYLNSFNPTRLAKLFRIELPEDILMDILAVLQSGPVTTDPEWSVKVLRNLSSVSSYSTTILFLSTQQKDTLRGILHQLSATDPTLQLAVLPN